MTISWIILGCAFFVALAIAAGVGWYGKKATDADKRPMPDDDTVRAFLTPRDLTAKEKHDATLKGALSYIRIPVK